MLQVEPHRDEKSSASPWFSPGLVGDNEVVLRTIFDPHHLDGGVLAPAAISLSDLRVRGWSVDRKRFTSLWKMKLSHRGWMTKKQGLNRCLVLPIEVGAVRAFKDQQNQIFSVTDMALCANPAHAAILLSTKGGDGAARKARSTLMKCLPKHVEVSEAFAVKDRWGWSRGVLLELITVLRTIFGIS
ncbi:hypothetical protein [Bradyrhizobium sp.]|uniref:hypothetical protein n=1 Tax=Bradyrhizobium sp. TaxID=376 RepID=UPI003C744F68